MHFLHGEVRLYRHIIFDHVCRLPNKHREQTVVDHTHATDNVSASADRTPCDFWTAGLPNLIGP